VSLGAFQSEFVSLQKSVVEIVAEKRIEHPNCMIHSQLDAVNPSICIVEANDRELKRIISNLINNAVEAKASDRVCEISVGLRAQNGHVVVSIRDNGKGFPPQILKRIGERGVSSVKANGRAGSGLGLFYAKVIVEQWKGRLEISSVEGKGARIELWLPQKNRLVTQVVV
jgi:signal transduction histidine kinase